ncbi:MAG: hypothetical protein JW801_18935 [Bacteroidales bacterium]|nr:hypothetical protein [Bacteroidales bacterium]
MRVAVSSTNGKTINSHFGKARTFYVYEIEGENIRFMEIRNTPSYASKDPLHAFRAEQFDKVLKVIGDCQAVYTKQIGAVPAEKLRSLGIRVTQAEGGILEVLGM